MKVQKATLAVVLFLVRLLILIFIAIGIYKVGEYAYAYGYSIVSNTSMEAKPGRDISVTLSKDMTAQDVAKLLERKGLVKDADIFRIQLKVNKYESLVEPGSYVLNTSMTPKEMMKVISGEALEEEEE